MQHRPAVHRSKAGSCLDSHRGRAGDGPEWNALQPEAGMFDERVFASLDWVIAQAKARGIRLCMPLVNYWPAYGGIPQYIR